MQAARLFLETQATGARLLAPFPHRGLGATSIFAPAGGGMQSTSLAAFNRSFSKGASLPVVQNVLECNAALVHAQGVDPSRRGNERKVRREAFLYLLAVKEPAVEFRDAMAMWMVRDAMWDGLPFGRVLSTPRKRKGHVLLDVLGPSGTMSAYTVTPSRLSRADYRYVRKLGAGSTVPMVMLGEGGVGAPRPEEEWYEYYDDE